MVAACGIVHRRIFRKYIPRVTLNRENKKMKSLNTKLVLSALAVALLATPAFAQRSHQQTSTGTQTQYQLRAANNGQEMNTYPNPQGHSGSEQSYENGTNTIGGF